MAIGKKSYLICDGCRKTDLVEVIDFVEIVTATGKILHICEHCISEEKYYCRLCGKIHNDDNPCKRQLEEIEAA